MALGPRAETNPDVLDGVRLGDSVLETDCRPGFTTDVLRTCAVMVPTREVDLRLAAWRVGNTCATLSF